MSTKRKADSTLTLLQRQKQYQDNRNIARRNKRQGVLQIKIWQPSTLLIQRPLTPPSSLPTIPIIQSSPSPVPSQSIPTSPGLQALFSDSNAYSPQSPTLSDDIDVMEDEAATRTPSISDNEPLQDYLPGQEDEYPRDLPLHEPGEEAGDAQREPAVPTELLAIQDTKQAIELLDAQEKAIYVLYSMFSTPACTSGMLLFRLL
jgi:hypothetical protein